MSRDEAEREMIAGYLDGLRGEPEPGANRSHSYRHGWANGRDDRNKKPSQTAEWQREHAANAIAADTTY